MTNSKIAPGTVKTCKKCKLPSSETVHFGQHKYVTKNGISFHEKTICKKCESELAKQYRKTFPDKILQIKKTYRDNNFGTIKYHVQEKISTWRKASCVPSDLTVDYLIMQYNIQDGYCYYTGNKMLFGWIDGKVHHNTLSLDKLDPSLGYVQGNVVWCTYLINTMKQNMNENEFYLCLKQILDYKKYETA